MLRAIMPGLAARLRRLGWSGRPVVPGALLLIGCLACVGPIETAVETGPPVIAPTPPPETVPPAEAAEEVIAETGLARIPFSIQVGAFSVVERAEAYAALLRERGLDTYYFVDTDGFFKVRFEHFDTREAALERAEALKSGGLIDGYYIAQPLSADWRTAQSDVVRERLLQTARRFIGTPYRWGGASASQGFDCSGLTLTVYRLNGLELPRSARDQYRAGSAVQRPQMEAGDLIFFDIHRRGRVDHVGIYCGEDQFIHAPGQGKQVRTASLADNYFAKRFLGARRYL